MDIDISDILAEVSRPQHHTLPPLHPSSSTQTPTYDPTTAYTDHILLTRAWTTERCTPSLLPYPTALISRVTDRLRSQITRIEDLTSGIYDGYPQGGNGAATAPTNLNLTLSILQTDLSRTQFLLRSYIRQRLAKVTRYAAYYSGQLSQNTDSTTGNENNNDTKLPLLSPSEQQFLQHHSHILHTYYHSSFLSSLPVNLRRMDDSSGGAVRMDEGPDGGQGVLVRCLAGEWGNEAEVEEEITGDEREGDGEEKATVEVRVERGGVLVGRWRDVKGGVVGGQLEVL